MLDTKLSKVLANIYKYENSEHDLKKDLWMYKVPPNLSKSHKAILNASNFQINHINKYLHNDLVRNLNHIWQSNNLEKIVSNLFIKAVGSGFHRGIQPILSYYFCKHLPLHDFVSFEHATHQVAEHCKACGLKQVEWVNDSENFYQLYIGYLNLYSNPFLLMDLEEVQTFTPQQYIATQQDLKVFFDVIEVIEKADADETLVTLEKRLSKDKCLPKSNRCTRLRVLWGLGELGILNNYIVPEYSIMDSFYTYAQRFEWELIMLERFQSRADPIFPASAWRGELGINRTYLDRVIDNAGID